MAVGRVAGGDADVVDADARIDMCPRGWRDLRCDREDTGVESITEIELPDRYGEVLAELKQRAHGAHLRAQRAANTELIGLYWHIGHTILEQQRAAGWGGKVVE